MCQKRIRWRFAHQHYWQACWVFRDQFINVSKAHSLKICSSTLLASLLSLQRPVHKCVKSAFVEDMFYTSHRQRHHWQACSFFSARFIHVNRTLVSDMYVSRMYMSTYSHLHSEQMFCIFSGWFRNMSKASWFNTRARARVTCQQTWIFGRCFTKVTHSSTFRTCNDSIHVFCYEND